MTGFNHGMTGAVIALSVHQPVLAVPLAFASHYATDHIPHFGYELNRVFSKSFNTYLLLDFMLAVVLMLILAAIFPHKILIIWACMIAAAAPDFVWWIYRKSIHKWPSGLDKFTIWHLKTNIKSHIQHVYYDVLWFIGAWVIIFYIYSK